MDTLDKIAGLHNYMLQDNITGEIRLEYQDGALINITLERSIDITTGSNNAA